MNTEKKASGKGFRPAVGLALLSLLVCGLFYPLLITGVAQVLFPYQANGEMVQLGGRTIGSNFIAQAFSQPIFFHPRNSSASGVDPDITVQDAYSQVARISRATGIPADSLESMIRQNTDRVSVALEVTLVNVLSLNLLLIDTYPSVYENYR
ncbi:MAG: potassium-transporting ATPase subunit C [Nitrososphaerales archaeon]|nr:potassium-transporting ATPase subunit C [Nitrososphaerales archaeon]